jgi:hypothetical protein
LRCERRRRTYPNLEICCPVIARSEKD